MSIFGKIKAAIFGGEEQATGAPAGATMGATMAATGGAAVADAVSQAQSAPAPAAPASEDEIYARLDGIAQQKGVELNYRQSIVDLMKLLDLDPSLDNRKELARELGYTGELNGSAEMNIWLHQQVMQSLANRGQ